MIKRRTNMVSLWEQESFLRYDVIIIGGGITGLSVAASLKEKRPALNVLVLERGTLPSGASTKNAGFACFGSISELARDRETLGDDGMVNLVSRRWQGLNKTIERLGKERTGFEMKGGYELIDSGNEHMTEQIEEVNDLLKSLFQKPVFRLSDEKIKGFGFGKTKHLICNRYEGQLHTGKLMSTLWAYCGQLGVKIMTGTPVVEIESGELCKVRTAQLSFTSKAVAVCTNAFTPQVIKEELDLKPGRGMVMLIKPEKPLTFSGTFHYEEGYYYFRDFHQKIIFGGGRNLDFQAEQTTQFGINEEIEKKLLADLKQVIIPDQNFMIEMKWSGIMAFGENKRPVLKETEPGLFLGVRLGGMGIAIGSLLGEELAGKILESRF